MRVQIARLTETYVKRLGLAKPGHTFVVRDEDLGGFHLRVSHKDKVFKLKLTVRADGKRATRGFTLGKSSRMTADKARKEAEDRIRLRDRGELALLSPKPLPAPTTGNAASDPFAEIPGVLPNKRTKPRAYYEADIDEHRDAYAAALAGARARNDADPGNLRLIDGWILFKDALHTDGKSKRTVKFYSDIVKRHLKQWHRTPLRLITQDKVRALHGEISARGNKATANQAVVTGGAIYTFALKGLRTPGLDPLTPWSSYRLFHKLPPRQTGLGSARLAAWWTTVDKLSPVLREANLFTLLSALRKENCNSLRWRREDDARERDA